VTYLFGDGARGEVDDADVGAVVDQRLRDGGECGGPLELESRPARARRRDGAPSLLVQGRDRRVGIGHFAGGHGHQM